MLIKVRKAWELAESAATPEAVFRDRRRLIQGVAAGTILLAASPIRAVARAARAAVAEDPSSHLYPAARNPRYVLDRDLTDPQVAARYNNFYEFGSHKEIWRAAQKLPVRPWTVKVDGLVE